MGLNLEHDPWRILNVVTVLICRAYGTQAAPVKTWLYQLKACNGSKLTMTRGYTFYILCFYSMLVGIILRRNLNRPFFSLFPDPYLVFSKNLPYFHNTILLMYKTHTFYAKLITWLSLIMDPDYKAKFWCKCGLDSKGLRSCIGWRHIQCLIATFHFGCLYKLHVWKKPYVHKFLLI